MNFFKEENSEYKELPPNEDLQKRKEYWEVAKGLQKVDGLNTSQYLEEIIKDTVSGKYGTEVADEKIKKYYAVMDSEDPAYQSREADLVASRITICLEREDFKFSPVMLKAIHKELFADVFPYKWVGTYRTVNLSKAEDILDGESMTDSNWETIDEYLRYDFDQEKYAGYNVPFTGEDIRKLSRFISAIWQTHPFREGNTRTVSTFLIKYLRTMGIQADNTPFMEHAKWFRDALVRSNYANLPRGIQPDFSYLERFFENVLLKAEHDLKSFDLRCETREQEGEQ